MTQTEKAQEKPIPAPEPKQDTPKIPEIGGQKGPDPTRYGDWEKTDAARIFKDKGMAMLVLLSPSKSQDFETPSRLASHTLPLHLAQSKRLIEALRGLSARRLGTLMDISEKLAQLNHDRYRHFRTPFTPGNAKQAIVAFTGDVYDGLGALSLDAKSIAFAQERLRMLSGLYGALKPLDLIQPYRLEMKIRLRTERGEDLYDFWGDRITRSLKADLKRLGSDTVINLASQEYFKAVEPAKLGARIVTPQFKEKKPEGYKMIALFAKQARGMMARYIIEKRMEKPEKLEAFALNGYRFHRQLSTPDSPVFTRG